jgi:hypothetical protein
MRCDVGTLDGMSAVIAGGPAAGALMPPLGCVRCHAWNRLSPALLLFSASCFLRSCLDVRRRVFQGANRSVQLVHSNARNYSLAKRGKYIPGSTKSRSSAPRGLGCTYVTPGVKGGQTTLDTPPRSVRSDSVTYAAAPGPTSVHRALVTS